MPARARKQKRKAAMRSCTSMSGSKQKALPKCEVCSKIAKVFLAARNMRTLRQGNPDTEEYTIFFEEMNLGTFENVMRRSTCDSHPRLLWTLFQSNGHLHHLGKEEVYCGVSWPDESRGIHISVEVSDGADDIWVDDLVLVPSNCRIQNLHIGRVLDVHYVDTNLLRRWKRSCDSQQHGACRYNPIQFLLDSTPPAYLIDTWSMCLVPGHSNASYIALSYVWGKEPFFQTTKANICNLQTANALDNSRRQLAIPRTISDAMSVVQLLGERYLWVDALCIVQDDIEMKHDQIKDMASIFANASITIMAHQGEDANYGLRGLRGISLPRQISQERFKLQNGYEMIKLRGSKESYPWFRRGWTYQEGLFSRRKLTFSNDTIFWDCPCSSFQEDLEPLLGKQRLRTDYSFSHLKNFRLTSTIPNLSDYTEYVRSYNVREFSFEEDALAAFSGIIAVASQSFHGGFVCGLPVLFFDTALCWQLKGDPTRRRHPSKKSKFDQTRLPSWSWVGWLGQLEPRSWNHGCNYVKESPSIHMSQTTTRTISTVQWYSAKPHLGNFSPILGPQDVQARKTLAQESEYALGSGWKRFEYSLGEGTRSEFLTGSRFTWPDLEPPNYYFKHESDPATELWYTLPTYEEYQPLSPQTEDSILYCHTQKSRLHLAERIETAAAELVFSLRIEDGAWAGILHLNVKPPSSSGDRKDASNIMDRTICDLVVISEGCFLEGSHPPIMYEYGIEERPKVAAGAKYEFYNVLWVGWEEQIAYRKGYGRVAKHLWDSLEPEWFDLVLG